MGACAAGVLVCFPRPTLDRPSTDTSFQNSPMKQTSTTTAPQVARSSADPATSPPCPWDAVAAAAAPATPARRILDEPPTPEATRTALVQEYLARMEAAAVGQRSGRAANTDSGPVIGGEMGSCSPLCLH